MDQRFAGTLLICAGIVFTIAFFVVLIDMIRNPGRWRRDA